MNINEFLQQLANGFFNARVLHKTDTESNWNDANPLLLKGEFAIVVISASVIKFKVGDGANNYAALPFCGDITTTVEVHAAVPTTNPGPPQGNRIYETATSGSYTHFLDNLGAPIVVFSGEYVRLIDEGTFFSKVIIPFNFAGYTLSADFLAAINNVYDLWYAAKPTRPADSALVNKAVAPYFGFPPDAPPVVNDWYVDMNQCFELSRLKEVWVRASVTGTVLCQLVTIDTVTGAITFLGASAVNNTIIGQTTIVDMEATGVAQSDPATRPGPNTRAYIAVKNGTNDPLLFDNAKTGNMVWQYNNSTHALTSKLNNTDIAYEVRVFNEVPLQAGLARDTGLLPIRAAAVTQATNADHTILVNSGSSTHGVVNLPRFGIDRGKTFVIKYATGTQNVDIIPLDSSKIDGLTIITMTTVLDRRRVQFDGVDWWTI